MTMVDVDLEVEKSKSVADVVETVVDTTTVKSAPVVDLPSIDTDPFAPREGTALTWKHINMTLAAKGDSSERKILDNVWGEVPQHCTTAVMGPSGAGKTCLLNILSGRSSSRGAITIQADVRLNNYLVDPTNIYVRKQIAFVDQDNSLQVTSTPRESIRFSAKLRLPRTTTEEDLDKLTQRMITELGLTSCADTMVGGALIKGISGGERKRTSVGVELVVKPALVFLDEPTSGLDSYSAVQLCQVLKKVAEAGASVLFTIHQPSSDIFKSFDNLILLNKGRVMYQGPVEKVPSFFEARSNPVPPNYNPADWIMNVAQSVSVKTLNEEGFFPEDTRDIGEAIIPENGKDSLGNIHIRNRIRFPSTTNERPPGMLVQTGILFHREIRHLRRDVTALAARFGLTIFLGTLVGVIFWNVGSSDSSIPGNLQSHYGALIVVAMMSMFGTAQPALLSFPAERPVFLREYSTNHYSVVSYFISRLTMEAVTTGAQILVQMLIVYFMINFQAGFGMLSLIIYSLAMASTALAVLMGCSVADPKLGEELVPLLFVPQLLFSGFFVRPDLIPVWLRWAQYLCTLMYSVRLCLIAEFDSCHEPSCETLLEDVDADPDQAGWYWIVLLGLFTIFRVGALFILRKKASKLY